MIKKFPIIRPAISLRDIFLGLYFANRKADEKDFKTALSASVKAKESYLVNSGAAAFYLILEALKKKSGRQEIILPAYTAGSLVVAVQKAGLKPVLCDVTLEDFNADLKSILQVISANTLAVVAVHMFGIPVVDIAQWRSKLPEHIWIIEDCCQAMGSRINDSAVGSFGDISFFSFNRGKNISTFGGGCIVVNNEELHQAIKEELISLETEKQAGIGLFFNAMAYCIATNPYVYGLAYEPLSKFKETAPPFDIKVAGLAKTKVRLGAYLLPRSDSNFLARYKNSMFLLKGLERVDGIIIPRITSGCFTVFNRLPILFKNMHRLQEKQTLLWKKGFESSRMYLKPLHHMFDLGYGGADFPNAVYFAEHLLTLPVYSSLGQGELERIIRVIKR